MGTFSLKEYAKENTNTKVKVFIEHLYKKFEVDEENEEFDNLYFSLLNEDDLIESLECYIFKNRINSQGTARNYITYITDFFDTLSKEYKIRNEVFTDVDNRNHFFDKSKEIISKLKQESESKDIASDEQYVELRDEINKYLSTFSEYDIHDEINKYKAGKIKYIKHYHRFVSVISTKLIMKYAFKNLTVILLDMKDLDIENKTIIINGLEVPLDKELTSLFDIYLRVRKHVIELYLTKENNLFIQHDGAPYTTDLKDRKQPHYGKFFSIMKDTLNTVSAELLSNRRILEMLDSGIDISIISKLSDRSIEKCIELQNNHSSDSENKLYEFLEDDRGSNRKITIKKKESKRYMKCYFCGREVKPISNEWVLVQYEDSNKMYLACRECKGENGKYRIQNI